MARYICPTLLVAISCFASSSAAIAAPARNPSDATYRFAIPGDDLADALTMFSITTSLQVVADGATLRGRRSAPLTGRHTAREALRRLLRGHDIDFHIGHGSVILHARPPRLAASKPARPARLASRAPPRRPEPARPVEPPQEIVVIGHGEARQLQAVPAVDIARSASGISPLRLVEKLPGVNFQSANALGTNEYSMSLSIRSFNQNQLGFTLDGVSLGDHSYDNFNGLHASRAVISDNLAQVTLMRGTSDIDTASTSNLGGTLKFETVDPRGETRLASSMTMSDQGGMRLFARLETGEIAPGLSTYVSGALLDAPNWKGIGREESRQINAKLRWEIDPDTLVRAYLVASDLAADDYADMSRATLARYGDRWDYLRGDFAKAAQIARQYQANPAGDCRTNRYPHPIRCVDDAYYDGYGLRRDLFGYVRIEHRFDARWTISLQPYRHSNRGEGTWWLPYTPSPGYDGSPMSVRSSGYRIRRYGLLASITGDMGNHQLQIGGWLESNRHDKWRHLYALAADGSNFGRRSWPDAQDRFLTYYNHRMHGITASAFVSDRWQATPTLRIEAGVRALRASLSNRTVQGSPAVHGRIVSSDAFLPQLGATWTLRDGAEVFASYKENMRAFGQALFGTDQAGFELVKSTVRPETARTLEAGLRWRRGGFEAALVGFQVDFDDWLVFTSPCPAVATCTSVPTNVGSVRARGLELASTWRIAPAFSLYAAWSLTDARYRQDMRARNGTVTARTAGKVAVNVPRHIASIEATYDDGHHFVRVTANHQGRRFYSYSNDTTVAGRTVVDMAAGVKLTDQLEFQVNASNLLNAHYVGTIGQSGYPVSDADGTFRSLMPGPARQVLFTLKHDLTL